MKKVSLIALVIGLSACGNPSEPVTYQDVSLSSAQAVQHTGVTGNIDLSLNLSEEKDVYFLFTTTGSTGYQPSIQGSNLNYRSLDSDPLPPFRPTPSRQAFVEKGAPRITTSNKDLAQNLDRNTGFRKLAVPGRPQEAYVAGTSTRDFVTNYDGNGEAPWDAVETIPVTCRYAQTGISTNGVLRNLYIWVENASWSAGGTKPLLVNQVMVDSLATRFLQTGDRNDIYDWVTGIFGSEWGTQPYTDLLDGDNQDIHIVVWDIDGDAAVDQNGGIVGYFWAKDNFKKSGSLDGTQYSNGMLNFSLDANFLAFKEGLTWETSDYWPNTVISTLAHEFQHMINWYQGPIKSDSVSETWINEMASMIAEDLVADKIQADGPRGVSYLTEGSGAPGNIEGRLPLYNYFNDSQLTAWLPGNDVLISYSQAYAFGAWLVRNYGGAGLIREIVQSGSTLNSILGALDSQNGADPAPTLAQLLEQWGAAAILSDSLTQVSPYRLNSSVFSSTTMATGGGDVTYNLGGINLYNYEYQGSQVGPWFWPVENPGYSTLQRDSNTFVSLGRLGPGTHRIAILNGGNTRLTVVLK